MRRYRRRKPVQLELPTHGGKRKRAGRKRRAERPQVPHRSRERFQSHRALHVTMRVAQRVWSLRSSRSRRVMERVLRGGAGRFGTRVVQIAVLGNHVHMLVEAPDHVALMRAMKGLAVRVGLHMNRMMGSHGRVMGDRYDAKCLKTPTQVKNAIHYIRHNFRKHEAQQGRVMSASTVDEYSSDRFFAAFVLPAEHFLIKKVSGS